MKCLRENERASFFLWRRTKLKAFLGFIKKCREENAGKIHVVVSNGSFRVARAIHIGNLINPVVLKGMAARESLVFA